MAALAISACALSSRGLQQRALGDVDEVAPVDDRRAPLPRPAPGRAPSPAGCGRARRACRRAAAPRRGRRRRAPRRRRRASRRSASGARRRRSRARSRPTSPIGEQDGRRRAPIDAERLGLGEQALDEVGRPQAEGERDEAAEAGPEHAREVERASGASRPDFCAASTSSSASSIAGGAVVAGIGSFCDWMTAAGRERRGPSSTAMRESSRRKARGRGGRSFMRGDPRSGIAGRGRAGSAGRAGRAGSIGGRKRTKRQSLSASGRAIASPSKIESGSAGSSPGKTAASATPSKVSPPIVSPFSGTPMIASRRRRVLAGSRPRGWRGPRPAR